LEVAVYGNPALRPGVPVALGDVGRPFEGKYTVTSVRHVFGDGKHYESWITVSGRQWRSLYGLASGGGGGGGGGDAAGATRLPGVANAIVSDWARSVQSGGVGGGGVFPMDVGDEVLVAFDRGALDHPFVIGGLYNGRDLPTRVDDVPLHDGLKRKAARHTLSDRQGNRVDLLSQRTGGRKQGVRIASGDDRLTIDLDRTGTEITVDSKGSVTIKGGRSVSIEAGTDLTLSARRRLTIKSGGLLDIQGRGIVNLKSLAGAVSVDAMGALSLKSIGATMITSGGTVQVNSIANVGVRALRVDLMGALFVNTVKYPFG
ncbi:phage baseplate assembly protein V, partial [Streptomyces sp. NPDC056492]|uniref:phage baseplate assembly protein V n=1 Tax=Streptomyces sp. NPDC056492 TaxID=3345838 RepID=UPI0036C15B18